MKIIKNFITTAALLVGLSTAGLAVADPPPPRRIVVDGVVYLVVCESATSCRVIMVRVL